MDEQLRFSKTTDPSFDPSFGPSLPYGYAPVIPATSWSERLINWIAQKLARDRGWR